MRWDGGCFPFVDGWEVPTLSRLLVFPGLAVLLFLVPGLLKSVVLLPGKTIDVAFHRHTLGSHDAWPLF